ncbi:hypothetical protein A3A52_05550 [Candidatus Woesebacteria bacterium RIFCSPLOWO2_01_FULL_39_14]|uniref:thioredoxin-dependent peroxiredoxin n=1 Tax=Candidatus Woesebacteria bacterium RIFCSPLOWO2_01_FULL_39_14 TaxID=1802518 RepID=A0A1F8BCE4_9BACT|nr:MAG: hypothetical protein A3A52_05550 [Candidatus Woesebacteria bacterium RIFCSPLOWO2_01_FULL_39_14]
MKLKIGSYAPDFELQDQNGKVHRLSGYERRWILIYFYPKDFTPGCTTEACSFRDSFKDLQEIGVEIIGISTDPIASHLKFAQKHRLPFIILSDSEKKTVKLYDVWKPKKFMGKEYFGTIRTSFLIDPKGKIAKIYEKVNPNIHSKEVLEDLKNFKN